MVGCRFLGNGDDGDGAAVKSSVYGTIVISNGGNSGVGIGKKKNISTSESWRYLSS